MGVLRPVNQCGYQGEEQTRNNEREEEEQQIHQFPFLFRMRCSAGTAVHKLTSPFTLTDSSNRRSLTEAGLRLREGRKNERFSYSLSSFFFFFFLFLKLFYKGNGISIS